jgi:hypothetical protein
MEEPRLSGVQRMTAARIVGAAARLAAGAGHDMSTDRAVAELHAITTDPVPLGYALGIFLHRAETDSADNQAAVDPATSPQAADFASPLVVRAPKTSYLGSTLRPWLCPRTMSLRSCARRSKVCRR